MKIKLMALGALVVVVGLGSVVAMRGPKVAPPASITVERTAARVARGQYLFELADCSGCHSGHDYSKYLAPEIAGTRGKGNEFPAELGLPGRIVARNITPDMETGLGKWTDGEVIRAIREGVSKDGRALFPMMPYQSYAKMSDEDVFSLVAYLRTLPAVKNEMPATAVKFPVSFFMQGAPQPVDKVAAVDRNDKVAYGKYLVTVGGCGECHSQRDKGAPVEGMEFAGGEVFRFPGNLSVTSANITPHVETGIGGWSEEKFVNKFLGMRSVATETLSPAVQGNFTLMPWLALRNLEESDLRAIYGYLKTLKPVANKVDPHAPAPKI